jgi:Spy/CpxP family protein refolding chaperone
MKKLILFTTVMFLVLIPIAYSENGPEPGKGGPGDEIGPESTMERGFDRVIDDLKLTDAQEQKIHEIRESSKRDIFTLRNEIHMAVWDIQDELKKEVSDKGKINSAIDRLSDAEKKLIKLRTEQMLKIKEVLTPEQFKLLTREIEKHKNKISKKILEKMKDK